MTELQAAIHAFYSQFAKAYPEPVLTEKNAAFPYIVYDYRTAETMTTTLCTFQIWDKASHITRLNGIADSIYKTVLGITGVIVPVVGDAPGYLKIMRSSPFIQSMPQNPSEMDLMRYIGNLEIKHFKL